MTMLTISKIILDNFRSHKHLEVEFESLNILIGENGGGKTTILEAICYALFGSVASGSKKSELIKYGEKSGGVTLIFSNNYKIVRDFSTEIRLIDNNDKVITNKASEIETYLNIDKEVFMNILYASQNDIYSYFMKFNAKEKDFIDSIFNLDNLTDKVIERIKNAINELIIKYNDINNRLTTRTTIENNITEILNNYQMNSIEDLMRAVEVSNSNLNEILTKQKEYNNQQNIIKQYEQYQMIIKGIESRIKTLEEAFTKDEENIENAKQNLYNYIKDINKSFNVNLSNIEEIPNVFQIWDHNCNISTHLDNIKNLALKGLNYSEYDDKLEKVFYDIIDVVNIISKLDDYRKYYSNLREQYNKLINNLNMQISISNNNKQQLEYARNELNNTNSLLSNLVLPEISQQENLNDLLMQYNTQYTSLKTTLDNLIAYKNQLDLISGDISEESLEKIKSNIESLNKVLPIFNRDGFVSFLRKSLLKDIANNIGESLEKFSFTKLLPVTIDEKNGALLFHGRLMRSLSGGEKTIASIILRVLYARLLSPSMKLNILMLDEPTADLDSIRIMHLRQLLQKLNKLLNIQIIVVTHDNMLIPENCKVINIMGRE